MDERSGHRLLHVRLILSLLAVFLAFVFAPWLAAFTETVEGRNPALMATGLAVWGWTLRLVVAGSLFALPYVVTSVSLRHEGSMEPAGT